jgi:[pyruvate, water dikinase]-phosphate phosphotransferase / [pyruvate, water dikinase] kinase
MTTDLYLFSDATGETVDRVVRAILSQFRDVEIRLNRFSKLRSEAEISDAVEAVASQPGLIVYTLVDRELAQFLQSEVESRGLEAVDILSPLLYKLSDLLGMPPQQEPGLLYQLNAEYHKRVEAVNFTVKQDDGQELRHLYKADVVLVGVSRTSKTPLSMYLAHKGYKVANVPLVKGIDPPQELFEIDQNRVVALLIDPKRLVELRTARLLQLQQSTRSRYASYDEILDELICCKQMFRRNPQWLVIDITHKSVEEAASDILKKLSGAGLL